MTDPKLAQGDELRQARSRYSHRGGWAPGRRWSVDAIGAAQGADPAKRARPGVIPLDWLTDHAHHGPLSGADCEQVAGGAR